MQPRGPASTPLRIVIAGGGTGGHVLPAVSVVEELRRREIAVELTWIGSHAGLEHEAASRHGIAYVPISTGKLRRYLAVETIFDAGRIPVGVLQAWRALRCIRPDAIFSTGGFVSVPTVVAGARLAPILTHEQTTILGLATKINARFADVLALSHEKTAAHVRTLKPRIVVTGNPVRLALRNGDKAAGLNRFGFSDDLPLLYVTGGARGSSPINERIEALLPGLLEQVQILHQTGPASAHGDAARLRALRSSWPESLRRRYQVVEFIGDELADVYAAASLVLSRAGAGTISELPLVGKPAILIPLPLSGGGEQDANARLLGDAGAAIVIAQPDATPSRLEQELKALLGDPDRLNSMGARARELARPDASARLTDALLQLAGAR